MGEVYSGFICGYAIALISTPILAMTLLNMRANNELMSKMLPEGTNVIALTVILHGGLFMLWTGLGIVLGLALLLMDGSGAALGSPNADFTLLVVGLIVAITAPAVALVRSLRPLLFVCAVSAIIAFGWLMPYLAKWSNFD